ncbi:MAG TPA: DUF389 domain-containing protein [Galbitalea sp.]
MSNEYAQAVLNDVPGMRKAVLFDGPDRPQRLSRFWILLVLAAVIASAGVVGDSTATVIGAMIVAPMMLPIQGAMLSTVLGDRLNLVRSLFLVLAGALVAVVIGYLVGLVVAGDVVAANNSQVASRVSPRLIDLLAALGTGVVGSIALVRRDISDTLPGVAISISLVPPLSVVGLTLESQAYAQSLGALLLFVTNVAAILATGVIVMAIYRVRRVYGRDTPSQLQYGIRRPAAVTIVGLLIVVAVPLAFTSVSTTSNQLSEQSVQAVATRWSSRVGWDVVSVTTSGDQTVIRATGPLPKPETASLAAGLRAAGTNPKDVRVELVPSYSVRLRSP